jgi:hypothetical protein
VPGSDAGLQAVTEEVTEGEVLNGRMGLYPTHAHRKGSDMCGPEDLGSAGGLVASFHDTPMDRSHLVGMIGEIGIGTGIVKREFAGNEEAVLVVAYGKRPAEGCASLAVAYKTVGKEQTAFCRSVDDVAGFPYKTVVDMCPVKDGTPCLDDAVIQDDVVADIGTGLRGAEDGTFTDPAGTGDLTVIIDDSIRDLCRIDDLHPIAQDTPLRFLLFQIVVDDRPENFPEFLVFSIPDLKGRDLGVEGVEEDHVAVSTFVLDTDDIAFAIGGIRGGVHLSDIGNVTLLTDIVVVDIVARPLYQAVVPDGHVLEHCVVDAGMLGKTFIYVDVLLEHTEIDFSIELDVPDVRRGKIL